MTTACKSLNLALQYHRNGDLQQAEVLYRRVLDQNREHPDALHLLGALAIQTGRNEEAVGLIRRAIGANGKSVRYHTNLAVALQNLGRNEEAAEVCRQVVALEPGNFNAYNTLGNALRELGRPEEAVASFRAALRIKPDVAEIYVNLGNAFRSLERQGEAAESYLQALALKNDCAEAGFHLAAIQRSMGLYDDALNNLLMAVEAKPDFFEAFNSLGNLLMGQEKLEAAEASYRMALQIKTDYVEAHYNLGNVLREQKKMEEAILEYCQAISIKPDFAEAYYNLGETLCSLERPDEAAKNYRRSLSIKPDFAEAYNGLGNVFRGKERLGEAMKNYQKALAIKPDFAEVYYNISNVFLDLGDVEEAMRNCRHALEIKPDLAEAHWNMSLALLTRGDYEEGWRKYERRFLKKGAFPVPYPHPRWDGSALTGKKILVYAEQGVGDEIMFASCLPEVIESSALCVVECDKRLVPLFARSFPRAKVIARLRADDAYPQELESADMKIAIGSLPLFLRNDRASFPRKKAYLIPDERKKDEWRKRIASLGGGLKVGISWRGGKESNVRRTRSTSLDQWAGLFLIRGIEFINLQYGECADELKAVQEKLGVSIHDWEDADPLKDLDGFAAQIAALDLVISVDNSTVHMAGAVGTPVWTLLPFGCDWRWLRDYDDTPWYSSMLLFRQKSPGGWEGLFERVSNTLEQYLRTGALPGAEQAASYNNREGGDGNRFDIRKSFGRTVHAPGYTCAVITPVGPGHERLYGECLASVEKSFGRDRGSFSGIIPIRIDDTEGRLGRSKARNRGVRQAAEAGAEWIFFLDADDLMSPSSFEYASRYLEDFDAVWGSIWTLETGEDMAAERPKQLPFLYGLEDVLSNDPFVTLQMGHFVKTSLALSSAFNEALDTGEDFDYYLRIWAKNNCIKIPLPLFYNRRGSHARGARSATGEEWRRKVEEIIRRKYLRGWVRAFSLRGREVRFFVTNASDIIQSSHIRGGFFEPSELDFIARNVRPGSRILEVGANIGNHAVYYEKFLDPSMVILIEPNPYTISILMRNLEINGCTRMDTSLLGMGAGKTRGSFSVREDQQNNLGSAYLSPDPAGEVEVAPLDELVNGRVDFIKIDVERMEMDVLEGAQQLIASGRPDIFIEIMNENIPEFKALLKKLKYQIRKEFRYLNAVNFYVVPD